jgi:hypothetical protein
MSMAALGSRLVVAKQLSATTFWTLTADVSAVLVDLRFAMVIYAVKVETLIAHRQMS